METYSFRCFDWWSNFNIPSGLARIFHIRTPLMESVCLNHRQLKFYQNSLLLMKWISEKIELFNVLLPLGMDLESPKWRNSSAYLWKRFRSSLRTASTGLKAVKTGSAKFHSIYVFFTYLQEILSQTWISLMEDLGGIAWMKANKCRNKERGTFVAFYLWIPLQPDVLNCQLLNKLKKYSNKKIVA